MTPESRYALQPAETASDPRSGTAGILYQRSPGGTFPSAHSGTAAGLARALAARGLRVPLVDSALPDRAAKASSLTDRVLYRLGRGPVLQTLAAPTMARIRARGLAPGTLLVSLTSQAGAVDGMDVVTFEDMTVALARQFPFYVHASPRALDLRERRQAELYEQAVACCVGSGWAARSLVEDYGVPPEKVHVVGRGHGFALRTVTRDWTVPRFLFLGRDWERKNGPRVLQAFAEVRRTQPRAELHLVGAHPSGNEPGVIRHGMLALSSPADRLRLAQIYEASTCLVMPSLCEAFGLSYVEAASFGLPSIGTTVGGADLAIGEAGMLVDPTDDAGLAAAMSRMADPGVVETLAGRAHEQASLFRWSEVARRILAAYAR